MTEILKCLSIISSNGTKESLANELKKLEDEMTQLKNNKDVLQNDLTKLQSNFTGKGPTL